MWWLHVSIENEIKFEMHFLSCSSHISWAQQPNIASCCHFGQHIWGTFPISQKVLQQSLKASATHHPQHILTSHLIFTVVDIISFQNLSWFLVLWFVVCNFMNVMSTQVEACSTYGLLSREIYLFIWLIFYIMLIVKHFLIPTMYFDTLWLLKTPLTKFYSS